MEAKDIDGMTALHMAAVAGHWTVCEYLLTAQRADVNCLVSSVLIILGCIWPILEIVASGRLINRGFREHSITSELASVSIVVVTEVHETSNL